MPAQGEFNKYGSVRFPDLRSNILEHKYLKKVQMRQIFSLYTCACLA